MPCHKIGNAIVCTRGRSAKPCNYCGRPSTRLCDFTVMRKGEKKTCDVALCDDCSLRGVSAGVDFCRPHYKLALEAYHRRIARRTQGAA